MEIARNVAKLAIQLFGIDDLADLIHRRAAGVPSCLRVITPESLHQLGQSQVCHVGEVRSRSRRVNTTTAAAIQQRDRMPRLLDQIRGRYPGNTRADDGHVGFHVCVEALEAWDRRLDRPAGFRGRE